MPVDRDAAAHLAADLVALYADAETRIATETASRLATGLNADDWAARRLEAVGQLRRWTERLTSGLETQTGRAVWRTLLPAYVTGGGAALDELAAAQARLDRQAMGRGRRLLARIGRLAGYDPAGRRAQRELAAIRTVLPGIDDVQRLAVSLSIRLAGTHLQITRWSVDAYRDVVGRASADALLGTATRRQVADRAWRQLLDQGVTGFVDRSGRRWELASYVEMATRTTIAQAAVQGHLDQLGQAGIDLVQVSTSARTCPRCLPWQGRVLSRTAGAGMLLREHAARPGATLAVDVAGTVSDAIGAGLMHPGCRHAVSAYLPGVSMRPRPPRPDPAGYAAEQQQRHLERRIRAAKLQAAAALTDDARTAAKARVRELQARIRAHVAAHDLTRKPWREQIGTAR